jgi:P4 family phage/plasmid primase-like protien
MIQIIGLRSFVKEPGKTISYDQMFNTGIPLNSVKDVLDNYELILSKISKNEHRNIFYTIASCNEGKRKFKSTTTIAFDIDKIKTDDYTRYFEPVCQALKVDQNEIGIVLSGNGLHFLISLSYEVTDQNFFKQNKVHYSAVCAQVQKALEDAGLPGTVDSSIFDHGRILRLPGTVNRKPDKPDKECKLIQRIGASLDFHLDKLSNVPIVQPGEQVDKALLRKYPTTDPTAVLNGCNFLKHCHENPNAIDEPTWYAALSIVARLDDKDSNGWERCHEMSKGHAGYTRDGTDQKISQAVEASGPRTCESIQGLWGKCVECVHWNKITSPILIHGDGTIRTEATGFHDVFTDGKGRPKYVPCHEDLIKFFAREKGYKDLGDTRIVYVWEKTHYHMMEKASLEAYARQNFFPVPEMKVCNEWRDRVRIANIVPMEWWDSTPSRKMNFQNGYLDIDTMEFRPHDPEIAFRSVLPYEYDPAATAPMFERMLKLVTGDDEDTIKVLEEFIGYCLSNDTCWAQKVLVLTGEGSNGKSTFVDAIKMLAGKKNYASIPMDRIDDQYNLATLDGKLFNIAEETSPKAFKNNSTMKNLATGGSFMVRMIYKEPYELTNRAKLILTCNELPDSLDQTHGFYRRLLIVPFNQRITTDTPGFDPHLIEKLALELPGIFNLAMQGYRRLVAQRGFTVAQGLKDSLDNYRLENDSVLYWVKQHLVMHTNGTFDKHFAKITDLYDAYGAAMKSMNQWPVTFQKFSKQLKRLQEDTWKGIPYTVRSTRKRVEVQGREVYVTGLQGVEIEALH